MEAIISALKEEQDEIKSLIKKYEKELKKLPQGSFFVRLIKNKPYAYISESAYGKISQKYLGVLSEEKQKKWQEKFNRAKRLKQLLRQAKKQQEFLRKALRHAQQKSKRGAKRSAK